MNNCFLAIVMGVALLISACGDSSDANNGATNGVPPRNVVVKAIVPQKLNIKIKLPVLVNPTETIELRAGVPGLILNMPYNEGDVIPASEIPEFEWTDEAEYLAKLGPDTAAPSDEVLSLRNLKHLRGLDCFARIDDNQLIESFVDAQANYDSSVRTLERTKKYSASTEAQLDAARTGRIRARTAVNRILRMLQNTLVCNPREGVLTKRYRQKGEFVGAGELLGTIAVVKPLKATVQVPEANHKSLTKGDIVSIWLPSLKRNCEAKVTRVGVVAHPSTHSFVVDMAIGNADLEIPAGIFGEIEISIYKTETAVVVPHTAVRFSSEQKFVYLEVAGVAKEVPVKIGHIGSDQVEVFSDLLVPGANLITVGAKYLADGDIVQPSENDPAEGE